MLVKKSLQFGWRHCIMAACRSVAQPGRVLRSGRRGRWFEPSHSDHKFSRPWGGLIYGRKDIVCENQLARIRVYENKRSEVRITTKIRAGMKCQANPVTPTIFL